jgi:putative heme iron utilization protein
MTTRQQESCMSQSEPREERTFELPPGYDGLAEARRLLRTIRAGSLATLDRDGGPFASLVNVATAMDGAPLLLMSGLSAHTQYLDRDARASILLAETGKGDPLAHPRLTVSGRALRLEGNEREAARRRFLARHPKSALYADFGDFSFWRLDIARAHLNGGFAKAASYEGSELLLDLSGAAALAQAEQDAIDHMNADHADALALYAEKIGRAPAGRWRASGIDPEGMDLMSGDLAVRLVFPSPIQGPADLRACLVALAASARS